MCLIVFAWQICPDSPLIAAANRDEFYQRPTAPACWWEDHPHIYAGRDLQSRGTWMGITRNGRFAAVTNVRNGAPKCEDALSRGMLVANYLAGDSSPEQYVAEISGGANCYNGFNLLVGNADQLVWYTNVETDDERNGKPLKPGIYGLCNATLDSPWPKVVRTKAQFASLLCQGAPEDAYFEMLTDTTKASDCRLPKTGVPLEWERAMSSVLIDTPEYGTRSSTIVHMHARSGAVLKEKLIR